MCFGIKRSRRRNENKAEATRGRRKSTSRCSTPGGVSFLLKEKKKKEKEKRSWLLLFYS